jgi:hypothetical protein
LPLRLALETGREKFRSIGIRTSQRLAEIGQNDRDGSQSRVAMLSDSGKAYTMLARASGRFG